MPWQNNGDKGDRQNPWGGGQRGGGGGGGEPPHIDEYIKKGQDQLKAALPGGKGGISLVLSLLAGLWLASGIYSVEPNEQAVVLQFGKWTESTSSGLHWHLPYPIETVEVRGVTDEKTVEIGSFSQNTRRGRQTISSRDESLMLTGDENIVDIKFNVVFRIKDLGQYLFNLSNPEQTVKVVSESVMREIVGKNNITPIITTARDRIQREALAQIQNTIDSYETGISILRVQIIESEAPDEVKDAFLDVQRAEADQQRLQNEADAYKNKIVPEARGGAVQMVQQAEAYRAQTVARAQGEAARFTSVYNEYVQAKDVTRQRMYLETMEKIMADMDKIILDGNGAGGVVPYLPLNELKKRKSGSK